MQTWQKKLSEKDPTSLIIEKENSRDKKEITSNPPKNCPETGLQR